MITKAVINETYHLNSVSWKIFLNFPSNPKYIKTKFVPAKNIKKIIMYWIKGTSFQKPILWFLVENPPDAILLIELFIASNKLIPASLSKIVSKNVRPT